MSRGRGRGARRCTKHQVVYYRKVKDPGAEDLPGAARVSGRARGRPAEDFRRHPGSSEEGFGDNFDSKIVLSGSKPLPGRFLRVER